MELKDHGVSKYTGEGVLRASSGAWGAVAAEHRHHPAGELPAFRPEHMEIGIATGCHPRSVVSRRGDGIEQRTRVEPGIVWLCPVGVLEEDIRISAWHEVLHLYLPPERFRQLSELRGGREVGADAVRYLGGFHDELIRAIGAAMLAEMRAPTSSGLLLVETMALTLTARLAQAYAADLPPGCRIAPRHGLDEVRLRRVLDYMAEHIDEPIGVDELASVACLSPFHFARMFRARMGAPPHRHLSAMRMERAKALLASGTLSIAEIALACCFANQANFTRAFRRATGATPAAWRRQAR